MLVARRQQHLQQRLRDSIDRVVSLVIVGRITAFTACNVVGAAQIRPHEHVVVVSPETGFARHIPSRLARSWGT